MLFLIGFDYIGDNQTTDRAASVAQNLRSSGFTESVVANHRKNEPVRTWFRSHRIFRANEFWYFHTREGIDVGPFKSEFEAQVESSILKHLLNAAVDGPAAILAIREFLLDAAMASSNLKGLANEEVDPKIWTMT